MVGILIGIINIEADRWDGKNEADGMAKAMSYYLSLITYHLSPISTVVGAMVYL